jgi:hypothetical protein
VKIAIGVLVFISAFYLLNRRVPTRGEVPLPNGCIYRTPDGKKAVAVSKSAGVENDIYVHLRWVKVPFFEEGHWTPTAHTASPRIAQLWAERQDMEKVP